MIVVSDASPITTLLKAGSIEILPLLFGEVIAPPAVFDELLSFHPGIPNFILMRPVRASSMIGLPQALGRGEREATKLGIESNADLFLTDDLKALKAGRKAGLNCIGTVGVVLLAKKRGLIQSALESISAMQLKGGLYLSDDLKHAAITAAGEAD